MLQTMGEKYLPIGNLRSYGDVCLNESTVILSRSHREIVEIKNGELHARAGATLSEILEVCIPQGYFLPVTPGTQYVTLAGAIAGDVHGKNHHISGNFGHHVTEINLLRSDGATHTLHPGDPLFHATIAGMGLTGIILDAKIKLLPIKSSQIDVERTPFSNLEEFFQIENESKNSRYTVAWIDTTSKNNRGIHFQGEHAQKGSLKAKRTRFKPSLPKKCPRLLNSVSVKALNEFIYRKECINSGKHTESYNSFFYPLDAIEAWNRAYGRKGFYQYQCVIPPATAKEAISNILLTARRSPLLSSFLTVIKNFGKIENTGILSFPMEGTTLAMDFPNQGAPTLLLFEKFDEIEIKLNNLEISNEITDNRLNNLENNTDILEQYIPLKN
jgi:FAD/FMN-containing dehydrogenase